MAGIVDAMSALAPAALARMTPAQRAEADKARAQAALKGTGPAQPVSFTKIECKPYLKTADGVEGLGLTTEDYQRAQQQLSKAMAKKLDEDLMGRLNDYVIWNGTNTWDYGGSYRWRQHYDPQLIYADYAKAWKTLDTVMKPKEDEDMAKTTPRTLYQFAIVNKQTDSIDLQILVAESETEARDEVVRSFIPKESKVKEFDVVLLSSKPLSPKVEK